MMNADSPHTSSPLPQSPRHGSDARVGPEKISIIGAGVIGLTTAIVLAERGYSVDVVASARRHLTDSAAAAALVGPVLPFYGERVRAWSEIGIGQFERLARDSTPGVRVAMGRLVTDLAVDLPGWAPAVPGFRPCADDELSGYPVGFWCALPIVDMPPYLTYLETRLSNAEGRLLDGTVGKLDSNGPDNTIVINCAGAAARGLANDPSVDASFGLNVVVTNPGLDTFFYEAGSSAWVSWFCHGDHISLGGIELAEEPNDVASLAEIILARCCKVEPRLRDAQLICVRVGARPVRDQVRLEWDTAGTRPILHHYGHGGTGVTTSWGSALEAAAMIDNWKTSSLSG